MKSLIKVSEFQSLSFVVFMEMKFKIHILSELC